MKNRPHAIAEIFGYVIACDEGFRGRAIFIGSIGLACCGADSMRRVFLLGTFFALTGVLCGLWAFRFQRVPGLGSWDLADLRAASPVVEGLEWTGAADDPGLRVELDASYRPKAGRITIPGVPPVNLLRFRLRMSSRNLTPGKETWEDGRVIVEWHSPDGGAVWENQAVGSVRYDCDGEVDEFVVRPSKAPAIPALRFEHLGKAGYFEVSHLEITALNERWSWKIGRWLIIAAWLIWGAACVRFWPGIGWPRAVAASAIWVLMGINCVIPGPWKMQRALYPEFQLGERAADSLSADAPP